MMNKEDFHIFQMINLDNKKNNKPALPSDIINRIGFYATRIRPEQRLFEKLVPFLTRDDIGFFSTSQNYPFLDAKKITGIEHFASPLDLLKHAFETLTPIHKNKFWEEELGYARVCLEVVLDTIIDGCDKSNIPGHTPVSKAYLAFAAMQPDAVVLKALLDRMKVRMELPATDHFHMTKPDFESIINRRCESTYASSPLDLAITEGNRVAVNHLLVAGAVIDIPTPNQGHYLHPLEIAIRFNRAAIFNDLMKRIEAYPLMTRTIKSTGSVISNGNVKIPLHRWIAWNTNDALLQAASENSQYEMMALLIKKGADPVILSTWNAMTYLDVFVVFENEACAKAYLEKFARDQIEILLTTADQNIVKNIYPLIQLVGGYEEAFTLLHIEDGLKMGRLYALGRASQLTGSYQSMTSLNSTPKIEALKAVAHNAQVTEVELRKAYGTQRALYFTSRGQSDTVKNMPTTLKAKLYP